jgi:plastocyanin
MRRRVRILAVASLVLAWSCGGGGAGGTEYPENPSGPTPPPSQSPPSAGGQQPIVINIIGERGLQSFSPSPATVPDGQMVVWRNTDTIVHRVVLNDRSVDTGDIPPGGTSAPRALGNVSKPYHCSLHPTMLGSLNNATPVPPDPYE